MTPEIEKQLSELEARHKRHQTMLDHHHEQKHQRREAHRKGFHRRKFTITELK